MKTRKNQYRAYLQWRDKEIKSLQSQYHDAIIGKYASETAREEIVETPRRKRKAIRVEMGLRHA